MSPPQTYVLITGCSAGSLGASLVDAFLHSSTSYHIFATLRTPSKAPPHFLSHPHITILLLSVLSASSIASVLEIITAKTDGRLNILVNNSGQISFLPDLDVDIEESKELFDLNFWAPLLLLKAFAGLLVEAKGTVVMNATVAAVLPSYFQGIYAASKAPLTAGRETWRLELALLGVRTSIVVTASVRSNFFSNMAKETLPEDSSYAAIGKNIRVWVMGG